MRPSGPIENRGKGTPEAKVLGREIERVLSDDYCCACDSYGHTRRQEGGNWCCVCWDWVTPVSTSVRRLLERARAAV